MKVWKYLIVTFLIYRDNWPPNPNWNLKGKNGTTLQRGEKLITLISFIHSFKVKISFEKKTKTIVNIQIPFYGMTRKAVLVKVWKYIAAKFSKFENIFQLNFQSLKIFFSQIFKVWKYFSAKFAKFENIFAAKFAKFENIFQPNLQSLNIYFSQLCRIRSHHNLWSTIEIWFEGESFCVNFFNWEIDTKSFSFLCCLLLV